MQRRSRSDFHLLATSFFPRRFRRSLPDFVQKNLPAIFRVLDLSIDKMEFFLACPPFEKILYVNFTLQDMARHATWQ